MFDRASVKVVLMAVCVAGLLAGVGCEDKPEQPAKPPKAKPKPKPKIPATQPAVRPQPKTKLLVTLPDTCPTPDGMAMDGDGNIIVACPNYADQTQPAVLMKIDKQNRATLYAKVPTMAETGLACPMGIAFGPDGDLYVCDNQGWMKANDKGRVLRLRIKDGKVVKTTVVAEGMAHPNGVRVHKGHLYVTVSMLPKIKNPDGKLASAVYRFKLDDENIQVTNTRADENLLIELKTLNPDCQYGADGIVFDSKGALYIGNFGDGALHKYTFNADGSVKDASLFAKTDFNTPMSDPKFTERMVQAKMRTTDGICIDGDDNIYVADFSNNALAKVDPAGKITVLAQNGDTDGADGKMDQPGEPIVRGRQVIVTSFDMVTGKDKVNTGHDKPHTIVVFDLD